MLAAIIAFLVLAAATTLKLMLGPHTYGTVFDITKDEAGVSMWLHLATIFALMVLLVTSRHLELMLPMCLILWGLHIWNVVVFDIDVAGNHNVRYTPTRRVLVTLSPILSLLGGIAMTALTFS